MKEIVARVTETFSRLHVLVVGPGLSRDQVMQDSAKEIMLKAREKNMAIVVDAVSTRKVSLKQIFDSHLCIGWSIPRSKPS